jgi:hypothetical protein
MNGFGHEQRPNPQGCHRSHPPAVAPSSTKALPLLNLQDNSSAKILNSLQKKLTKLEI